MPFRNLSMNAEPGNVLSEQAGVSETLWSVDDLVVMSDAYWADKNSPKTRGPYKKQEVA